MSLRRQHSKTLPVPDPALNTSEQEASTSSSSLTRTRSGLRNKPPVFYGESKSRVVPKKTNFREQASSLVSNLKDFANKVTSPLKSVLSSPSTSKSPIPSKVQYLVETSDTEEQPPTAPSHTAVDEDEGTLFDNLSLDNLRLRFSDPVDQDRNSLKSVTSDREDADRFTTPPEDSYHNSESREVSPHRSGDREHNSEHTEEETEDTDGRSEHRNSGQESEVHNSEREVHSDTDSVSITLSETEDNNMANWNVYMTVQLRSKILWIISTF
jgi:hypothetical protein